MGHTDVWQAMRLSQCGHDQEILVRIFSGSDNELCQLFADNAVSVSIVAGCLQLLEILEISLNLYGHPGNFCVKCR